MLTIVYTSFLFAAIILISTNSKAMVLNTGFKLQLKTASLWHEFFITTNSVSYCGVCSS